MMMMMMMIGRKMVSLALCLVALFAIVQVRASTEEALKFSEGRIWSSKQELELAQDDYVSLNQLLTSSIKEDSTMEENLEFAFKERERLMDEGRPARPALELFYQLALLKELYKCTEEDIFWLVKNQKAIERVGKEERITKILTSLSKSHAINCQQNYENKFDRLKETLDEKLQLTIDAVMNPILLYIQQQYRKKHNERKQERIQKSSKAPPSKAVDDQVVCVSDDCSLHKFKDYLSGESLESTGSVFESTTSDDPQAKTTTTTSGIKSRRKREANAIMDKLSNLFTRPSNKANQVATSDSLTRTAADLLEQKSGLTTRASDSRQDSKKKKKKKKIPSFLAFLGIRNQLPFKPHYPREYLPESELAKAPVEPEEPQPSLNRHDIVTSASGPQSKQQVRSLSLNDGLESKSLSPPLIRSESDPNLFNGLADEDLASSNSDQLAKQQDRKSKEAKKLKLSVQIMKFMITTGKYYFELVKGARQLWCVLDNLAQLMGKGFRSFLRADQKAKIEQYARDMLVEPCEKFDKHFGKLFKMVEYDLKYKGNSENEDFYKSFAQYQLCNSFLEQKQKLIGKITNFGLDALNWA